MRVKSAATRALVVAATMALFVGSVLVGSSAARADVIAPAAGYGFAQGAPQLTMSAADLNRELDAVSKTRGEWLRVLINWSEIESTKGTYNWAVTDRVIKAARAHKLKVLSLVLSTPAWARRGGALAGMYAPPSNPASIAPFLKAFIKRYPDVTRHEIWNEPNLPAFWGLYPANPTEYTALLKASYTAIKAVQPSSTVVAAGMSPGAGAVDFVTKMYAAGAKNYFNATAMHAYVFPKGINSKPNGWSETQQVRSVMTSNGDAGKKIWLTEMGAPTRPAAGTSGSSDFGLGSLGFGATDMVTQQEQATQIVDVLRAAGQSGYCGPAFLYSVRDQGTSSNNREDNFGALLTNDWQPKITATVLAK
ncbi:cellulase family glycosylhydrolase [Gordonia sp. w5E2]|uniref:Glycoside hydrolase family 5 domain-containing protein n=1 Tax=Gordonia jacobaea TaxID=122202 RepID=A0ABR5II85_9ACTN|nr:MULTISPECIES: cellulase family glycosylhydrolase [Gordonia]KNA93352.1 hypothetical protein ABW18_02900 [Gordonia jacobaea]SKX71409.1 beta-1,4-xylanase [Mycobacteroides abscessus subsp. abscessus]